MSSTIPVVVHTHCTCTMRQWQLHRPPQTRGLVQHASRPLSPLPSHCTKCQPQDVGHSQQNTHDRHIRCNGNRRIMTRIDSSCCGHVRAEVPGSSSVAGLSSPVAFPLKGVMSCSIPIQVHQLTNTYYNFLSMFIVLVCIGPVMYVWEGQCPVC